MQKARRHIGTTPRELFLGEGAGLYLNRVSESFELEEHTHEFIEFNFVMEGKGFQHIQDEVVEVAGGDLFYLPLGTSHVFRPASPERSRKNLVVCNCLFGPELLELLAAQGDEVRELLRVLRSEEREDAPCRWRSWKDRDGQIRGIFSRMLQEYNSGRPFSRIMLQTGIIQLLVCLSRMDEPPAAAAANGEGNRQAEPLSRAIQWMSGHAFGPLSVGQAAAAAGMSERHFRRTLKAQTGLGFMDYIHKLRIERSCALLAKTDELVAEIAAKSGYQDVKFFSRLFKQHMGMTPREYRRIGRVQP